jgi:HK97 gp10 family phage protein
MAFITSNVTGADMLLRDLEKMLPKDADVDDALKAGAEIVCQKMIQLAPTGPTGDLKKAIKVGNPKETSRGRTVTVGVHRRDWKNKDYYPAYVEYGHAGPKPGSKRTPAHHYIRPAYENTKDEAWAAIKQHTIDKFLK